MWSEQMRKGKYNFSYGSRIHGNILALINKIPSYIKITDSRVREIAEYFRIPNSYEYEFNESRDCLYDLYSSLDYTDFNMTVRRRFKAFREWLNQNHIPNVIGNNEAFKLYISGLNYYDWRTDEALLKIKKNIYQNFPDVRESEN